MSGSKSQKGFTLIEVSLAIVIGVIVLAGAITLYNQSKISAGNSKLSEKSLALAGLVEEMAAQAGGTYPAIAALKTRWEAMRDDAKSSPYGGALTNSVMAPAGSFTWGLSAGTGRNAPAETIAASAGCIVYSQGANSWVHDVSSGASESVRGYFVAGSDNTGTSFAFVHGGR